MVKTGFHYKRKELWDEIIHEFCGEKEIRPHTRLVMLKTSFDSDIPDLPGWAHDPYIFAFPDQEAPGPWKNYDKGHDYWDLLTKGIGQNIVCLKFEVLPEDEAHVVERAHYADFQEGINKSKRNAIRKYALSRVPVEEYDGNFRMPELIIKNPLGLDRLVLHNEFIRSPKLFPSSPERIQF